MLSTIRFNMVNNITAVLGIYMITEEQFNRTKTFLEEFKRQFPEVPISLSCVGSRADFQDLLKVRYGDEVVKGTDERVSFSETWNNAITNIKTDRFVLLHNDMYLAPDFFTELDKYLTDPKKFHVYTTVEPLKNMGYPRPGKIVADFGEDIEDFKKEEFLRFAKQYRDSHQREGRGYGFYISGFTESLRKVGGFDFQTFNPIFCEDDDLMVRIRKQGYLLCTAPSAILYHFGSKTTREIGAKSMSRSEIEMNRNFARKWGFEARYLWSTGYEFEDGILDTGMESIGFQSVEGKASLQDLLNTEPLVDKIDVPAENQEYAEYARDFRVTGKTGKVNDCDIIITQVGPGDFELFARIVGGLRFKHSRLELGRSQYGPYVVQIQNLKKDKNRCDVKNYLSLQMLQR